MRESIFPNCWKLYFFPPCQDKEREVVQLTESIDRDRMLIKVSQSYKLNLKIQHGGWTHMFLKTMFDLWHMCVCWDPKWTLKLDISLNTVFDIWTSVVY